MTTESSPLVTAVIPAYNAERYLRDAIDSVLGQTFPGIEVIVVDDGSTDGTARIARSFGDRVQYVHQENRGVSSARNRGVAMARGTFIAFLDADDVWLPNKIQAQLDLLSSVDGCVAVGCGLHVTDASLRIVETRPALPGSYERLLLMQSDGGVTSGSRLLARTDAIRQLGGCDTRMSTSADWDLVLRLFAVGHVDTVPDPLVLYREHGANMHRGIRTMERDMTLLVRKAMESGPGVARALYRRAMARLYGVLAGSYWQYGSRLDALRCAAAVLRFAPTEVPPLLLRALGVRSAPALEQPIGFHRPSTGRPLEAASTPVVGPAFAVSLVIPLRNEAASVEELIRSIRAQTLPPMEVIMVDGGSTDATVTVARRLTRDDPRFKVIEAGDATPGRGRNVGIAMAAYEWVALTDAGIRLEPDWLKALVDQAQRHPDASVVYGAFDPLQDSFFEQCAALAYVPAPQATGDGFTRGRSIASSLLRRDVWKAVGGFPDLRAAEDLMFMERVADAGFREVWAPRARVWWRLQPTLARTWRRFVIYSRCNVLAGRQRFWHYGVARQYLAVAVCVLFAFVFSPWWFAAPVAAFAIRVARSIWTRRGPRPWWWCLNPAQFVMVAIIVVAIDVATFVGWGQAIMSTAAPKLSTR